MSSSRRSGRLATAMSHNTSMRSSRAAKSPAAKTLHRDKPDALTHENQELLKKLLVTISKGERSIERQRQVLAALNKFEPHSAFQRIDRD